MSNSELSPEQLSEAFDTGPILPEDFDDRVSAWRQLGDCLRQVPVVPADLSFAVMRQLRPTALPRRSERRNRVVAVLTAAVAIVCVSLAVLQIVPETAPSTKLANSSHLSNEAFSNPANWDVVLVTVPQDTDQNMFQMLRQSFVDHGLQIHSVSLNSADESLHRDDLMGADVVSNELLQVLTDQHVEVETEWNPEKFGDFDREELLTRFAVSLQSSTLSDEHFGEMVVVLPRETMVAIERIKAQMQPQIAVAGGTLPPVMFEIQGSGGTLSGQGNRESAHPDTSKPVLFVFRRKNAVPLNLPGKHGMAAPPISIIQSDIRPAA